MNKFAIALVIAVGFAASPPSDGYASCTQAAKDGATNIAEGSPGYSSELDRDGDGVACESSS